MDCDFQRNNNESAKQRMAKAASNSTLCFISVYSPLPTFTPGAGGKGAQMDFILKWNGQYFIARKEAFWCGAIQQRR